jgi:hypothetical protein
MTTWRTNLAGGVALVCVLPVCAALSGCRVAVTPRPPRVVVAPNDVVVTWRFYPDYDVYWSDRYGWSYWDGVTWVITPTRPWWITISGTVPWVSVQAARRPYTHWRSSPRRPRPRAWRPAPRAGQPRVAPRARPRVAPRARPRVAPRARPRPSPRGRRPHR